MADRGIIGTHIRKNAPLLTPECVRNSQKAAVDQVNQVDDGAHQEASAGKQPEHTGAHLAGVKPVQAADAHKPHAAQDDGHNPLPPDGRGRGPLTRAVLAVLGRRVVLVLSLILAGTAGLGLLLPPPAAGIGLGIGRRIVHGGAAAGAEGGALRKVGATVGGKTWCILPFFTSAACARPGGAQANLSQNWAGSRETWASFNAMPVSQSITFSWKASKSPSSMSTSS